LPGPGDELRQGAGARFAFEVWAAELLLRIEGTDADPADLVYKTNDLKVDIAFEEEDGKVLVLGQTKFVSIASNPDVSETEVHDFFKRHEIFLDQDKWFAEHASEQLHDLLVDYRDRLKNGWAIKYLRLDPCGFGNPPYLQGDGTENWRPISTRRRIGSLKPPTPLAGTGDHFFGQCTPLR
jgi:hypothetical protein